MPLILHAPPCPWPALTPVVCCSLEQSLSAQGDEGRTVDARIQEVLRSLRDRHTPESIVSKEENTAYRHVPLKTVGTIRVRYKAAVSLRPRQFVFDDEDE